MITNKDVNYGENTDHSRPSKEKDGNLNDDCPDTTKDRAETSVKNAHASGDGAMGPNETPLPDLAENKEEEHNEAPPY